MTFILYVVGPLLLFSLTNALFVFFVKKPFGTVMPITLMLSTICVYMSQLIFKTFDFGVYLCVIFAILGFLILVIKRNDKVLSVNFRSEGLLAFFIIYVLFLIVNYNRCFTHWDELSHWGKMIKEMCRLDAFYSVPESDLLVHKEYPPFTAVFQMLWCLFSGGYSEGASTMALHVFEFALLLPPLVEKINLKNQSYIKKFIIQCMYVLIIGFCVFNFDDNMFNTIYLDLFMPIMYVYLICLVFDSLGKETKEGYFALLIGQFSLILIKQMSIPFVLLTWFFYTLSIFGKGGTRKDKVARGVKSIGVLVVPYISYTIWRCYVKSLGLKGQFDFGKIKLGAIWDILRGGGTEIQKTTSAKYIQALFSRDISLGMFELSYVAATMIAILVLIVLHWKFKEHFGKKTLVIYSALFSVGSVGYAVLMFVLYMFCYAETEMERLVSYERYMSSYVLSEYLILCILFITLLKKCSVDIASLHFCAMAVCISMIFCGALRLSALAPQQFWGDPLSNYRNAAKIIQDNSSDEQDIYLIASNTGQTMFYINYYLDNRDMDYRHLYSNVSAQPIDNMGCWESVREYISENQYVYVWDSSENVNAMLGDLTETGYLVNNTLYEVRNNSDGIKLIMIQ